jgi:nitroreductase
MDLLNLIKSRRCIRNWNDIEVPTDLINTILEAGIYAPSSCASAKVKFQVIESKKLVEEISKNTSDWFVKSFPNKIIVVYFDLLKKDHACINYREPSKYWSRFIWQDSAAAMQNMLLMAEELGVKTCWVSLRPDRGGIHEREINNLLDVPPNLIITSFVFLGYSDTIIDYNTFTHQGNLIKRDLKGSILNSK